MKKGLSLSLNKSVGKTVQPHAKKRKIDPILHYTVKLTKNCLSLE